MKLADARGHYEYFSGALSDLSRQLSFAGIAVVWVVILSQENGQLTMQLKAFSPLHLFCASLIVDLMQYIWASAAWGFYHRYKEKKLSSVEEEFLAPIWMNHPTIVLFWSKVSLVCVGYIFLLLGFTR